MEIEVYELDLECEMPVFDEEYWRSMLEDPYEPEEPEDAPHYLLEGEELILVRKEAICHDSRSREKQEDSTCMRSTSTADTPSQRASFAYPPAAYRPTQRLRK